MKAEASSALMLHPPVLERPCVHTATPSLNRTGQQRITQQQLRTDGCFGVVFFFPSPGSNILKLNYDTEAPWNGLSPAARVMPGTKFCFLVRKENNQVHKSQLTLGNPVSMDFSFRTFPSLNVHLNQRLNV